MDTDLYDEFGNYIGPELDSEEEEEEIEQPEEDEEQQEYDVKFSISFIAKEFSNMFNFRKNEWTNQNHSLWLLFSTKTNNIIQRL